uniref:Uncharacterized protein n=1 Tax=Fagus sylvatica TaxID=28930 RepID=A0A2N9G0U8_FAGSY
MSLAEDLKLQETPGSANCPKNVVIVMDGMQEFTTEPLEWALKNVIDDGCIVALIGIMPWLNIPLSSKTWLDVWMLEFKDLPLVEKKSELRNDVKYQKLQAVAELCKRYGGEVVMIRGRPLIKNCPGESPASFVTTPGEDRWGAGQSSSDAFVSDLQRIIHRNFFVGVCQMAESEGRPICFGDLIPADCVLRHLSEELFNLAFPAISTWRSIRGRMAFEGSSWPQVRFDELPEGLSDREDRVKGCKGSGIGIRSLMMLFLGFWIPDERACLSKYDDMAFYEVDFNSGLRFPLQLFMRELLDRLHLSPCQLAPNAWRTVISCMVMWRVCSEGVDSITVDELLYCYKPYQIAVSPGFWTLNSRQRGMKLVTGLPTSNREWKDGYVFVCGENWEGLPGEEKDDSFVRVRHAWGTPLASTLKRPKLNREGLNRVLRALHHRDHHYTNFIQPDLLTLYSFGPEPNEMVLSIQETNQKRMATAKLNKGKLKRVMEQKDAVPVSLGKKHRGDLTSRSTSSEAVVCPVIAPMPAPVVQAPTSSVEDVEPVKVPSSSCVVEKAPTLALDAFLALRQAKSVVTKEDVDDYAKLNTDVVKRALAHSLMKGLTEAMVVANRCMQWEEGIVKLKSQLTDAQDANRTLSSTVADLTREKSIMTDDIARMGMEAKQAKEKYPNLDFDVFQPYEDDDSVAPVEERDEGAPSVDP